MFAELKELALEVSTDPDHKFDLAIQLDNLDTALALARSSPHLGSQSKWRTVGDRALAAWKVALAEECFKMANDFSALLLIYTSTGDRYGLTSLSEKAASAGQTNIAFACALQLGESTAAVDLLLATERAPEAALFARTYAPSQTSRAVGQWRSMLEGAKKGKQAAAIADPGEQAEEFGEGWEDALRREEEVRRGVPLIDLGVEQLSLEEAGEEAVDAAGEFVSFRCLGELELMRDAAEEVIEPDTNGHTEEEEEEAIEKEIEKQDEEDLLG